MKQKRIFLFIVSLAVAALSCRASTPTTAPQTETPAAPSTSNADFSAVDAHINAYVDEKNLDGASLIVTDSGGKVIYQKNYGADFDEHTVVPIASATKWLTGATVMTLVEDSLISSLDDPVSKYLPYFADKGAKSNITIRQMLAFTSGLPDHIEVQDDPNITQQDECAFVAENVELLRDPGTGFEYGGLQEELAACVAEAVTGKPFREIMQERLLTPLGMTDTQLANMVNRNPRNPDYTSANPLTPGGIYSNASDLIQFSQMILAGGSHNGVQILAPETVQAMTADQTFGVPLYKTIWTGEARDQWRYGLGNWVQVLDPTDNTPEAEAKRLVSSEGAFGTSEWVDFDLQYAAAFTIWARPGAETTMFVNDLKNLVSEAVANVP
jgi:CubicO group peptidase (beta-lactamase class C family)